MFSKQITVDPSVYEQPGTMFKYLKSAGICLWEAKNALFMCVAQTTTGCPLRTAILSSNISCSKKQRFVGHPMVPLK